MFNLVRKLNKLNTKGALFIIQVRLFTNFYMKINRTLWLHIMVAKEHMNIHMAYIYVYFYNLPMKLNSCV